MPKAPGKVKRRPQGISHLPLVRNLPVSLP